jgi:hypothetical protein
MSETQNTVEGSKIERALAADQHEQRQEQEAAIRREEELSNRLAAQLAQHSDPDAS